MSDETLNALARPELLTDICAALMEGGTLVNYCREHGLKYKLIIRWIADDKVRQERYDLALQTREQHAKDLIIAELIAWIKAKPLDAFVQIDTDGAQPIMQAMKPMQDWPQELQRLVIGFEFEELFAGRGEAKMHVGRLHKVKFIDKVRGVENFMKHLAMLVDRKPIDVRVSLADLIAGEPPKPQPERV